jgi:hypothetical protein
MYVAATVMLMSKHFSLPNRLFFMLASVKKSLFFTLKLLFFTLELLFFTLHRPAWKKGIRAWKKVIQAWKKIAPAWKKVLLFSLGKKSWKAGFGCSAVDGSSFNLLSTLYGQG